MPSSDINIFVQQQARNRSYQRFPQCSVSEWFTIVPQRNLACAVLSPTVLVCQHVYTHIPKHGLCILCRSKNGGRIYSIKNHLNIRFVVGASTPTPLVRARVQLQSSLAVQNERRSHGGAPGSSATAQIHLDFSSKTYGPRHVSMTRHKTQYDTQPKVLLFTRAV